MGKFIQLNDANWKVPYVGGWCEGYVEGAWGVASLPTINNQTTSGVYYSATDAWNKSQGKHTDYPPAGITVPVFFSLGSTPLGHVAIRLDDLMVASSTQGGFHSQGYIHPNIQNLIDVYGKYNNGCQYLGWSEFVGGKRVVEYQPDITYSTVNEVTEMPYQSVTKEDNTMLKGTLTTTPGTNGQIVTTFKLTFSDGAQINREQVDQVITKPVDEITTIGTFEEPVIEETPVEDTDHSFIERLKALIQIIIDFFTKLKG